MGALQGRVKRHMAAAGLSTMLVCTKTSAIFATQRLARIMAVCLRALAESKAFAVSHPPPYCILPVHIKQRNYTLGLTLRFVSQTCYKFVSQGTTVIQVSSKVVDKTFRCRTAGNITTQSLKVMRSHVLTCACTRRNVHVHAWQDRVWV